MSKVFRILGAFLLLAGVGVAIVTFIGNRTESDHRAKEAQSTLNDWQVTSKPKTRVEPTFKVGQRSSVMRIPKFGLVFPIVEGTSDPVLKKGIGHFPDTAKPGEVGNFALAGHRCCKSNGQPFRYINELVVGDPVIVETALAIYTYAVVPMAACKGNPLSVVEEHEVKVIWPEPCEQGVSASRKLLTMTTCEPYGRERTPERLVAWAELKSVKTRV